MSAKQEDLQLYPNPIKEYNLFDIIYILWLKKITICCFLVISLLVTYIYLSTKPIYNKFSINYEVSKDFHASLTSSTINTLDTIKYTADDFANLLKNKLNDEASVSKAINENSDIIDFIKYQQIDDISNLFSITTDELNVYEVSLIITNNQRDNTRSNNKNQFNKLSGEEFLIYMINFLNKEVNYDFSNNLKSKINSINNQILYLRDDLNKSIDRQIKIIENESSINNIKLNQQLEEHRNSLDYSKQKEIRKIQDAIKMATHINLINPMFLDNFQNESSFYTQDEMPLFLLGSDVLKVMLEETKDKDLFFFDNEENSNAKYINLKNQIDKINITKNEQIDLVKLSTKEIYIDEIELLKKTKVNLIRAINEINELQSSPFITIYKKVQTVTFRTNFLRTYILASLFGFLIGCLYIFVLPEIKLRNESSSF